MHPAYSVILFTTASGAGYGLLFWAGLFAPVRIVEGGPWVGAVTMVLALGLITIGLLSSTFHLGHPERAWRAFSQWRSSWLSREGVAAVAAYAPAGLFGIGWIFLDDVSGFWGWMGAAASLLAAVTVYCTGMIYASLRTIPAWSDTWTVPGYLSLAAYTGALLLHAIAAVFGTANLATAMTALVTMAAAAVIKLGYWRSIASKAPRATAESATGLGGIGKVRLLELPHTQENYIQTEMGFAVARKHADKLRRIAIAAHFLVPFILCAIPVAAAVPAAPFVLLAVVSAGIGVAVERFLFFAEAKHVVTLYYGAETV